MKLPFGLNSVISSVFDSHAPKIHQLPVPQFINPRFENGMAIMDVKWENTPVTDECFTNAKDMCTAIAHTQITTIDLDQLSVWNDALKEKIEKTPCKYLKIVSYSVFAAQLAIAGLKGQAPSTPEAPKAA